jgi:hypothetical protein
LRSNNAGDSTETSEAAAAAQRLPLCIHTIKNACFRHIGVVFQIDKAISVGKWRARGSVQLKELKGCDDAFS